MINKNRVTVFFSSIIIGFLAVSAVALGLNACSDPFFETGYGGGAGTGYEDVVLDLPFAAGYQSRCTFSTENDIALDTPDGENDLVYAPIGGTARVHMESADKGFGYHVNIDRGNGTFVVVYNLAAIFVADGEEVAAGQVIGFEGCTGDCADDRVGVGLRQGDAGSMAEFGRAQSVSFWLDDVTDGTADDTLASADFVCGAQEGHVYESNLAVPTWHPDGSLVKSPNDGNIYLLDGGARHLIVNDQVFWSRNYELENVAIVSNDELDCYSLDEPIDTVSAIDAGVDADGTVWLLKGSPSDPDRFRARVRSTGFDGVLQSWGLGYRQNDLPPIVSEHTLEAYPESGDFAYYREGTLLYEVSGSEVYAISRGVAMPLASHDVLLKLGWGARSVLAVSDGDIGAVQGAMGNCAIDSYCIDHEAIETCGGDSDTLPTDEEEEEVVDTGEAFEDTASETENEDPSSMLEGEIDEGEFGFAYVPEDGFVAYESLLIGTVVTADGNVLSDGKVLQVNRGGEFIYTTSEFPDGGVTFYFIVQESQDMGFYYACELDEDGVPVARGEAYALFGELELPIELSTDYDTGIGCVFKIELPMNEVDPDKVTTDKEETEEEEVVDTGGGSSSSSTAEVEICYAPGGTMLAGELYLDGGFFTAWDSAPADSASSGDTEMCAVETVVSGEEVKMNAWFLDASTTSVDWAAYNNWCTSIDWQGTVTVDGTPVSVTTEPWSAAAWASDPCTTGGDAFFNIP